MLSPFLFCLPLRATWQMGSPATLRWQLPSTSVSWWPWGRTSEFQSRGGPWLFFLWHQSLMLTCCQDTVSVFQCHRSTEWWEEIWSKTCLQNLLPPPQLVLSQISFPLYCVSLFCWLNHTVSQFGKMIMEADYGTVLYNWGGAGKMNRNWLFTVSQNIKS